MNARLLLAPLAGCVVFTAAVPVLASSRCHMIAHLTAQQEISLPAGVPGWGCGEFVVDTTANTLSYRIVYDGLTSAEDAAQIHGFAEPGVNGGVLHVLPAGPIKTGVFNYTEDQEADLLAGRAYVHIHTANNTQGELRGQIVTHVAAIDAGQITGSTPGAGSGWGTFVIDKCSNTLTYHIVINTLTGAETSAALHGPAIHRENGASAHSLPLGNIKTGSWNYPESLEEAIEDGRFYVRINTAAQPNGAVRGQVAASLAVLDEDQVVTNPPSPSGAIGVGFVSLDRASGRLGYDVRLLGMSETNDNTVIHAFAPFGQGGPAQHTLPSGNPKRGIWTFGTGDLLNVMDQLVYIDSHTGANPDGEIRGQVNIQPDCLQRGDADYDEDVDFADVTAILSNFGATFGPPVYNPANIGDANYDSVVNFADVTATLSNFAACYR